MPQRPLCVVFDFDGVICNTLPLALQILGSIAGDYGFRKVEEAEIEELRGLATNEILKRLEVPMLKLPLIIRHVRREMRRELLKIPATQGMPELFQELSKAGCKVGILSSNSSENIESYLKQNEMKVDFVSSSLALFGKARSLRKISRVHCASDLKRLVYVGDETRDIEAAQQAKVYAVAVSWGYASVEILRKAAPDLLITQPAELLSLLEA